MSLCFVYKEGGGGNQCSTIKSGQIKGSILSKFSKSYDDQGFGNLVKKMQYKNFNNTYQIYIISHSLIIAMKIPLY